MRQRRAKIYRKMLHAYQLQFSFREPYQLLIDDTFSLALSRYKISDPVQQFGNVLQSKKIKPLITQCCMQALYALGKEHQSTVDMAKAWERRMCNHREAIDPQECVKQCVGKENKHRYIVASEQGELRRDLRLAVAGVPMMHFTQAVMVLEPMSPLTKSRIEEKEDTKLSLPASEAGLLKNQPSVEVDIVGEAADEEKVEGETGTEAAEGSGRRRKRKAPNPLSVRKPKNPRLTMEEKLQKEQEYKKQKQRNAAKARMEASKLDGTKAASAEEKGGSGGRKRRGSRANKDGSAEGETAAPKAVPVAKPKKAVEPKEVPKKVQVPAADTNGEPKKKKVRSKPRPEAANGDSAESSA
ncbi:rRNA-processing protein Fcf1/Utp23 [Kalmanozyma brasiliensis GHG001]|uniref:U three protein 23 n=1 Tax=Kalmanozyma brasiliensis (strain GHG001) TaxID=1365824 RepID=V5ESE6_KALBG|nr:rRNA-processing protein Fcf1/Utp23 [Kalmanozyma brasiliensis GHG001]EST08055.1 rRNA-processing protein Fcf1/Utp23 [Kalmanozyma brasiliensis GHG001]